MNPAAISVIGVIAAAVLGAVINQWWTGRNAARAAQRDYEYDAKKKLLTEVQPLLFELSERSCEAFWRIYGVAKSDKQGRLNLASKKPRFRPGSKYYLPSTIYRLLVPVVLYRMLETELGRFDFSLVPEATEKYRRVKLLHRTWNSGAPLAGCGTAIAYDPEGMEESEDGYDAAVHSLQHVRLGDLDNVIDLLTVHEADGTTRYMRYGEFYDKYQLRHDKTERSVGSSWSAQDFKTLNRVATVFANFSPATKPVLWRMLLTQAVVLHWITLDSTTVDIPGVVNDVRSKLALESDAKSIADGLAAAEAFLLDRVD